MNQDEQRARLEDLYAAHAASVRGYLRRRTDSATTDDLLSDVFVVAWRRLEQIPPDALPWLLACARNLLANSVRSERRRTALIGLLRDNAPPATLPIEEPKTRLAEAFATLRSHDREALLLVAWEGLSSDEAAAVVGCSRRTFARRLQRARNRLAAALRSAGPTNTNPLMEACND
ncbi:MAG TPA: sigma-70 family RNA polymerase sigma factor [Solirubrobacteraceae bacterium]|jgi:RNA polymerase sigma-70 factor (ECF subfamily)|nr:sigma-70 family RNA polymerase sigma factor [Solirubrobacteraceae bacterium]